MKRTMSKNDFYRRFSFFLLDKVIDDIRYERFYFTNPLKFLTTKDFFLEEIKEDKISVLDFIERYFEKLKSNKLRIKFELMDTEEIERLFENPHNIATLIKLTENFGLPIIYVYPNKKR